MVKITPEVEQIFKEMESDGWPVIEAWIDPLINAGFGELPCLVVRNIGRHLIRLNQLKKYLAEKFRDDNHLRQINTYPECIEAIKKGERYPAVPQCYNMGR